MSLHPGGQNNTVTEPGCRAHFRGSNSLIKTSFCGGGGLAHFLFTHQWEVV